MTTRKGTSSGYRRAGYALAIIGFALRGDSCTPPPPPPPPITFSAQVSGSLADDAATLYRFVAPALGNNASIAGSFRAEDAIPASGTYLIEVFNAGTTTLIASSAPTAPGDPTLLADVAFAAGASYDVKLTEVSGAAPRSFKLTMSPRYTLPATNVNFATTTGLSLAQGEFETLRLTVGAGETGLTDFFMDDVNVSPGNNVVTVVGADKVTPLASLSGGSDVSLDASDIAELNLGVGVYTVIVTSTDSTGQGTFTFSVGTYAGQDDTAGPCEVLPVPPTLATPVTLANRALSPIGDRDCFEFSIPFGVSDIAADLNQLSGSTANNELRLSRIAGPIANKKGSGDINATFSVDSGTPDTYQVVVNNLANGTLNYDLTIGLEGPCIGSGCVLSPEGSVALSFVAGPVDVGVRADLINQDPLPLDAAASFQFDKTSSGTFKLELLGDRDGTPGNELLCPSGQNSNDFFLENCDLTTVDGLVTARVTRISGSGSTATLRMGPELAALAAAPAPILVSGDPSWTSATSGGLDAFGDERYYSFTLAAPGQIGIGFDDQGIGDGKNLVSVYDLADLDAVSRGAPATVVTSITPPGTADGDADAVPLAAGSYALVVDNDGLGQGAMSVCVGAGDDPTDEDGQSIAINVDLLPTSLAVTRTGNIRCGDTDTWALTTTFTQNIKVKVDETPSGAAGSVEIELSVEDTNNPGVFIPIASKSGSSSANFTAGILAGKNYRLKVDNSGLGHTAYLITITDSAA